ncbi:MAG: 30S ribosomal protein S12 methylthiotransferase RimO [Clostridiales bacterium]|nr:30S ribosomal protein S12 methylthiotransferase RimO [Clostridiales bacterium]
MPYKVGMVSLGCAKNLVDSEQMLWLIRDAGYELCSELSEADAIVVNTCAFVESAKSEAIENILEFAALKNEGRLKKLIVAGCLAQRYGEQIISEIPEVDAVIGCGSFGNITEALGEVENGAKPNLFGDIDAAPAETDRIITTGEGWAYIKIAEGCDNRCAYCVIPSIRGRYRSRPADSIIREAKKLAEEGIREIIIVAQDITRYGTDLTGERMLPGLIRAISEIDGIEWIRLHYLYPDEIDEALIREIADNPKVVKYLDIPIQHIDDGILKRMNRRGSGAMIKDLFAELRRRIPGLVLRTSLITGLPGEGEAEFERLCDFLREARIERAGVFTYSPEEGTPAAQMPEIPDEETAARRADLISQMQAQIMDEYAQKQVGTIKKVLCEGYDRLAECWYGRSEADSPDVDGKVFFTGENIRPGGFYDILVQEILDGDLVGELSQKENGT